MGLLGESIAAYAQPLIDKTDGSLEQLQKTMALAQMCWNMALMPEENREAAIERMRYELRYDDEADFAELRDTVILPMIQRHKDMFPVMHDRAGNANRPFTPEELLPGPGFADSPVMRAGRNAPCPCGSGKKYKKCCWR